MRDGGRRPRIAIVFPGDSSSPATWSGTPFGVGRGLREAGADVVHLSSALPPRMERAVVSAAALGHIRNAGRSAPVDRARRAYRAAMIAPSLLRLRSAIVRGRLARADLDGCIQIGASFPLPTSAPVVTYEDMTVKQALDYPYEHWSTLTPEAIDWRIEAQRRAYHAARACCLTNSWARRSVVESYGIDPGKAHVVGVGTNQERRQLDRDWSRPRYLFVGREWERKNGPAVVDAFAELHKRLPDAELHLVGEHAPVKAPGVVDHGVLRQDVPADKERLRALFDSATCFVMPSLFEPSAIVYTEAAAAGIPSIGTRVGGSEDLIGDGGIAVDPASREEILLAMERFADATSAREAGARAAARAELFEWRKVAERLLRALGAQVGRELAPFLPADPPGGDPSGRNGAGPEPTVSVLVPARNAASDLPKLFTALSEQTAPRDSFEVIVVDDCSTDGTRGVVRRAEGARLVELPEPSGPSAARNAAVQAARAPVIAFTDADCRPTRTWLADGLAALERGDADILAGDIEIELASKPSRAALLDAARHLNQDRYAAEGFGATANLWLRRATFERVGPFNKHLFPGEDQEFGHRAVAAGVTIAYAPEVAVHHPPRSRARDLWRKAYRSGVSAAQQRAHAGGALATRATIWNRPGAYVPNRGLLGIERVERRGFRLGRRERLVLQVLQYVCIQLPIAFGDLAGVLAERRNGRGPSQ